MDKAELKGRVGELLMRADLFENLMPGANLGSIQTSWLSCRNQSSGIFLS